jgi:DNA polymerase-3 subunit delta
VSKRAKKKIDGISYEEFRRQVKEDRLQLLYLFVGEEEYFQERALELLYKTVDEASRIFNVTALSLGTDSASGARASAAAAIDIANQMPMMSPRRIVVIRDFDKIKEDYSDALIEYLKRPAPTASVVFQAASLDQRRKLSIALMKAATVVTFDRLGEQRAARWAEDYLKRRGCQIEPGALTHLIALVGTRMMRLVNELDKLATNAGGGIINNALVEQLVPRSREHSTFELWDAIIERDRRRALRLAERLLDDNPRDMPLMIVGSLAGLYRRMLMAKDLMARRAPAEEVMKATGQYGQRAKDFNARVLRTPREEITRGLSRIAQVDSAIKSSDATPRLHIQYLIAELTLPESARWAIF